MKHLRIILVLLTATLILFLCLPSHAAKSQKASGAIHKGAAANALGYSFSDESHSWPAENLYPKGRVPLGNLTATSANTSPGVTVGYTYYDYQHNCSMGRMIETGPHSGETGPTIVHMGWMHLSDTTTPLVGRTYMYNAYKSTDHSFAGAYRLHDYDDEFSGYVNVDVTPDNRALVGGHCDQKGPIPYQTHIHFDACPACELFDNYVRVPDSTAGYDQVSAFEAIWPKFFLQFGTDTVLHVAAEISDVTPNQALMYFRKVGYEGSTDTEWDYPPYVVDSVPCISQDITGQRMGDRVCMAWTANLRYQEPDCDTCSGETVYGGAAGQMDNDLYYQVSNTQGVTWEPRINITQADFGIATLKAFCDVSILFDQSGYMHLLFNAHPWPADPCWEDGGGCWEGFFWPDKARMLHWSENIPYVRTVADHTYDPSNNCGSTEWGMTVAKPTLSECDGKLYAIWGQFNDIPSGIDDDCAQWVYDAGSYWGGANAEIWVSVSSDNGMTWDAQRNLTNTYTPNCDPALAENCQNDYWPSMSRWGRQVQTGEDWSMAQIVDPSGGTSPTDYYLDIQYINDLDAGAVIKGDEGSWTNNPVKWFRLPCVEPVPNPYFIPEWTYYGDPYFNHPGEEKTVSLSFENAGNVALEYTLSVIEDNGPAGWLGVSGYSGTVPSGLGNIEYGSVILNVGGMISTTGNYFGRLHVEGNDPARLPADLEIELVVIDTICPVDFDVVNTNCLALAVSNYGNMGRQGLGEYNMDYYGVDCDTFATVYLYDGSPFLARLIGDDTNFTIGIWGGDYLDDYGFRPQCGELPTEPCLGGEVYESGTFTTQDSTVAFEKVTLAPGDDCEFILEYLKVWSWDGLPHDGLMLGEVIDWDIPADFRIDDPNQVRGSDNMGGVDGPRNLLWLQGLETYGAGTDTGYPYNCQYNDERFGGNAFIESYLNGSLRAGGPYGGFIGENDVLVYPVNEGFVWGAFYEECVISGLRGTDSTEDQHTAMVFEPSLNLGATDVYEVVTVLATIHQGTLTDLQTVIDDAVAWYTAKGGMAIFADANEDGQTDACEGCCVTKGDANDDGSLNPLDAAYFVNWLWKGGPEPPCMEEADVNADGSVNPLDAVYLVNFFWKGGPAPVPCG